MYGFAINPLRSEDDEQDSSSMDAHFSFHLFEIERLLLQAVLH